MKRCPQCNRVEADDTLAFCRADGVALINDCRPLGGDTDTAKFGSSQMSSEIETSLLPHASTTPEFIRNTGPTTVLPAPQTQATTRDLAKPKLRAFAFAAVGVALVVVLGLGYFYWSRSWYLASYEYDWAGGERQFRRAIELNPKYATAHQWLGELLAQTKRFEEAQSEIAMAHIGLNEKEEVLQMLEKEVTERGYWASTFAVTPELDELRSQPRFKALIKRLNLPE